MNDNDPMTIENALIESARFDTERGLSAWLSLKFNGSGQGFGGYLLYAPSDWKGNKSPGNYCGHFIYRCLEIAEVDDWSKLAGRTIRVKHNWTQVAAIGHIIKDDWFDPKVEFETITNLFKTP